MKSRTPLEWNYNDGGREDAGYNVKADDCVTRALAIASEISYKEAYKTAWNWIGRSPRNGFPKKEVRKFLEAQGFKWKPLMRIGSGCTNNVSLEGIPSVKGTFILKLSSHLTTVIDGVINDTYDPSRGGTRCIYGYYVLEDDDPDKVVEESLPEAGAPEPLAPALNFLSGSLLVQIIDELNVQANNYYPSTGAKFEGIYAQLHADVKRMIDHYNYYFEHETGFNPTAIPERDYALREANLPIDVDRPMCKGCKRAILDFQEMIVVGDEDPFDYYHDNCEP